MTVHVVVTYRDQVRNLNLCAQSGDKFKMILNIRIALQPLEFFNVYPQFTNAQEVSCLDSFIELADLFNKV
jgi:hypothetical protein